MVRKTWVNACS
uniref:Uncharacterized protein n=1 Tax=Anguilla anguilla TaxID=7936 RepID=A0A0E9U4W8_ANGAN